LLVNNFIYSAAGQKLTEGFEGLRLTAYQDVVGVWTIGYGHTGPGILEGMTITLAEAIAFLLSDIAACVAFVNSDHVVTVDLTQYQFDALVDFAFNEGRGALLKSTLLKNVNLGDFTLADTEFAAWDYAGGKVCEPLEERRIAEAKMFAGV
jgi:lysozyme